MKCIKTCKRELALTLGTRVRPTQFDDHGDEWLTECGNKLHCGQRTATLGFGVYPGKRMLMSLIYITVMRKGCYPVIPQGRLVCHLQLWREETPHHFLISMISLKGSSFILSSGELMKINVPKILIHTDIFSLVCAYAISGRMPVNRVILVEWREARAGSSEWWEKGGRET